MRYLNSGNKCIIITLVILGLFTFTGAYDYSIPEEDTSYAGKQHSTPAAEDSSNKNDGPHVYWKDDSSAVVFYLCDGRIDSTSFNVFDTLRFSGFCDDPGINYIIPRNNNAVESHIFVNISRILAVSDIHGDYQSLIDILSISGVITEDLHWDWGKGHLVILGDVFDRGAKVTECLWLIYRLEREAKLHGGRVHFILGNHEIIALQGDLRYVNEKYLSGIVKKSRIEYDDIFGPDLELGRWLRTKHSAVMLNDILFVHGGISPQIIERGFSLDDINQIVRDSIDIRSSKLAFSDRPKLLFGSTGPFWYRGYFESKENVYDSLDQDRIERILNHYKAEAIVVGHTEVDEVVGLHGGKIIAIDVPVEELQTLQALLWKSSKFYRVNGDGSIMRLE